jgi:hypothetical protein
MQFCTVITRKALLPRNVSSVAVRSMASRPPLAPAVHSSPEFNRSKEEKRLENHSYKESPVSSSSTQEVLCSDVNKYSPIVPSHLVLSTVQTRQASQQRDGIGAQSTHN